MSANPNLSLDKAEVLGKSVLATAEFLGLSAEVLGNVIGRDRTSISRLKKHPTLEPTSKAGELALLLIRIYRGLYAILGGNQAAMREWLMQNNRTLDGRPIDLIQNVVGLTRTLQYIDAMRGKI
jgi:uncharacterized protein (DUF2384 family)